MTSPLTLKQVAVLQFLHTFQARNGSMPTRVEIAAHFGFHSGTAAECHLRSLADKGCIAVTPGIARGVKFLARAFEILGTSATRDDAARCIALPVIDQRDLVRALQGRAG